MFPLGDYDFIGRVLYITESFFCFLRFVVVMDVPDKFSGIDSILQYVADQFCREDIAFPVPVSLSREVFCYPADTFTG